MIFKSISSADRPYLNHTYNLQVRRYQNLNFIIISKWQELYLRNVKRTASHNLWQQ